MGPWLLNPPENSGPKGSRTPNARSTSFKDILSGGHATLARHRFALGPSLLEPFQSNQ